MVVLVLVPTVVVSVIATALVVLVCATTCVVSVMVGIGIAAEPGVAGDRLGPRLLDDSGRRFFDGMTV